MTPGIVEIISLLFGLSGFGIQPNSKAPTADQALEYAMAAPDVTVHVDAVSLIPGNYKVLESLPDQPGIKSSPELQKEVREAVTQIQGLRGMAKSATGIDPITDVYDATSFAQYVQGQNDPSALIAVHGNFTSLDKVAGTTGQKVVKVGSGIMIDTGKGNSAGITKDKVLLFGSTNLVKERLADSWKPPAHGAGTTLGNIGAVIDAKPVFAVVLTLSDKAKKEVVKNVGGQNFLTDIVNRHKLASFSIFRDGIGWQWIDSNKTGLDDMAMLSDGFVDMLRAFNIAPRGFAKIVIAGLDSYKGVDKKIDEVIKHKDDLMKLVEAFTGDGNFGKKIDKDPKSLTLTVRLTGKTLSEVFPGMLPVIGAGFFVLMRSGGSSSYVSPPPAVPAVPAKHP